MTKHDSRDMCQERKEPVGGTPPSDSGGVLGGAGRAFLEDAGAWRTRSSSCPGELLKEESAPRLHPGDWLVAMRSITPVVARRQKVMRSLWQMMGVLCVLFVTGGCTDVYNGHISNSVFLGTVYRINYSSLKLVRGKKKWGRCSHV